MKRGEVKEIILKGIPASPGVAIGTALHYIKLKPKISRRKISDKDVESEINRFLHAIERSKRELHKIFNIASEKLGQKGAEIFEAQILMLNDETIIQKIINRVREERVNVEFIINDEIEKYRKLMLDSGDEYLKERANDLEDLKNRVIRNIQREKLLSRFDDVRIVVAENLTAADTVLFSRNQVLGYATDLGGATSHTAILSRALKIPAVVGLREATKFINNGDTVILDGYNGILIINPSDETVREYELKKQKYAKLHEKLSKIINLPSRTLDGHKVSLMANIEFAEEVESAISNGAEGIGLFRTEQYILTEGVVPGEDEQYEEYMSVVEKIYPNRIVIRTFDVGGDKIFREVHREENPFLGWRGIRIGIDRPEIFLEQMRAILRASVKGNVWVMFPMISSVDEVRRVKKLVETAKSQLREEKILFDENIKLGIMIEVPSAAMMAKELAREVDFFSIGTNDLIQYMLAVDRGNERVANIYEEFHPSVLRLIKYVVDSAHRAKIPVAMCGEMAADPLATTVLVGLGLDELSVTPEMIPEIKQIIRSIKYKFAKRISRRALIFSTSEQVREFLKKELKDILSEFEI
jgi:phosphotransferase system enzyme I (PtsI)